MATGIVSTAAARFHFPALALALLVVACCAFPLLCLVLVWRCRSFPAAVLAEFSSPRTAFGFFAFVAGAAVLGERLDELHEPSAALTLFSLASLGWLFLTYAIPARQILLRQKGLLAELISGDWLLWVVATQSIATIAAMLGVHERVLEPAMAVLAVWAWSVGVVLYLVLMTLLMVRLLTAGLHAAQMSASYWISMGATAITTLAGARILGLSGALPILVVMRPVVGGVSFIFWSFGTWWIPLLVVFGIWRHVVERHPIAYDREFWSIVFPLGMYATASAEFGGAANLGFMYALGSWVFWPALLAWAAVSLGLLIRFVRSLVRPSPFL